MRSQSKFIAILRHSKAIGKNCAIATQQILTSVHDCFTELNILICDFIAKLCVVFHLCLFVFWNPFLSFFLVLRGMLNKKSKKKKVTKISSHHNSDFIQRLRAWLLVLKAAPNTSNQVFAEAHQVDIVNFFSKLLPIGGPAEGRGRVERG